MALVIELAALLPAALATPSKVINLPGPIEAIACTTGALSGALHASRKHLDLMGVMVVAICTGVGGGAIRDILLDSGLPTFLVSPSLLLYALLAAAIGIYLPLELMVKRQTSETANFFGFHDRGVLAVGKKADVNVIDYDGLRLHIPEVRYDLPMGGRRLVQRVDGYRNTFVSGVCTFENGQYTGATPGRLVRAGRV